MAVLSKKNYTLSIIVLNYNTHSLLFDLLAKLGTQQDTEILVVDNSAVPSAQEFIKKNYPSIRYFFIGENLGFSGGNNYAIQKAQGEWVLLLNSDTATTILDMKKLVAEARRENYLVAVPQLRYRNNHLQKNAGYFDSFFCHPLNWLLVRPRFIDNFQESREVHLATAACMLIHSSVFTKIGLFDERNFFMYFEDMDFSYRLYKNNVPILFVPSVVVTHLEGATADQAIERKHTWYTEGRFNYIRKYRGKIIASLSTTFGLFR